jgi:hypothetical protein
MSRSDYVAAPLIFGEHHSDVRRGGMKKKTLRKKEERTDHFG